MHLECYQKSWKILFAKHEITFPSKLLVRRFVSTSPRRNCPLLKAILASPIKLQLIKGLKGPQDSIPLSGRNLWPKQSLYIDGGNFILVGFE